MNYGKIALGTFLTFALSVTLLTGCTSDQGEDGADATSFSYSEAIDDNGFWKGVTALDYVDAADLKNVTIPKDTHEISDEAVQEEMDSLLAGFSEEVQVTDRAVEDGDTINMDYVGSVNGVEFDGGSTGGAGTEVTIGVTSYIDGFLEQLVGHSPGETFDINVTFPEDYGKEELNGKDAVFEITINHITEMIEPEFTDGFVVENLAENYGWKTVEEAKEGLREKVQESAIQGYLQDYLAKDVAVSALPDTLVEYQEQALLNYYTEYAEMYGVELNEFLEEQFGVSTSEELIEDNRENTETSVRYYLAMQAVAEDAGLSVSDEDITNYFLEGFGSEDYSAYEEQYGMPYLKQVVLNQKALDYLIENSTLE